MSNHGDLQAKFKINDRVRSKTSIKNKMWMS